MSKSKRKTFATLQLSNIHSKKCHHCVQSTRKNTAQHFATISHKNYPRKKLAAGPGEAPPVGGLRFVPGLPPELPPRGQPRAPPPATPTHSRYVSVSSQYFGGSCDFAIVIGHEAPPDPVSLHMLSLCLRLRCWRNV